MKCNWNQFRMSDEVLEKRMLLNFQNRNAEALASMTHNMFQEANYTDAYLASYIQLLEKDLFELKLEAFLVGRMILSSAESGNLDAWNLLVKCYILDPLRCTELQQAIAHFDSNIDGLCDELRFQVSFCHTFGIATNVNHAKAVKFFSSDNMSLECEMLSRFLYLSSDNLTVATDRENPSKLKALSEKIKDQDASIGKKLFLTQLLKMFIDLSEGNGWLFPNLFSESKHSKAIRNLIEAIGKQKEVKRLIRNGYLEVDDVATRLAVCK